MTSLQKITLITGATRGLGRAAALQLAVHGHHIIALGRTVGALEELDDEIKKAGSSATLVPIDFNADLNVIDQLGATIHQKFGRLDNLILAAATLADLTPVTHLDPKIWQQIMQVNVTANARLLRSLHPLLSATPNPAAAFISCSLGHDQNAYWGAYHASKAALASLATAYAAENARVRVLQFDPGAMATRLYFTAFPGAARDSVPAPATAAQRLAALLMAA